MQKLKFTKMVASGNDFVVLGFSGSRVLGLNKLAQKICCRKYGVGADGMLVLEKSKKADIRMRIFNADGSEAKMCGNGAKCVALYMASVLNASRKSGIPQARKSMAGKRSTLKIETKAGIISAQVKGDNVKIKLTDPKNIKLDLPIKVNNRALKVNFIDTGVPHVIIFSSGLEKINVAELGRLIRYHKKFAPRGTNVNFIETLDKKSISIRTYERGVEDETLACGTGSVASALVFASKAAATDKIYVHTKSGEILSVYFHRAGNKFSDVWLEGKARIAFKGEILA